MEQKTYSGEPSVTVVIPTFNRADAAIHCAQSILASEVPFGVEVIVVDDCSTKCDVGTELRKQIADERVRVIRHPKNLKLAAARNTGGHAARGKYVLFLDDDNELTPRAIALLVETLETGKYGIAAPLAVNVLPDGSKTVWASSFAFSKWISIPRNTDANVPYTEAYEKGIAGKLIDTWYSPNGYMMSKELFEEMGGFCEFFGFYMEESDLCMRVRESGRAVCVVADAVTWHRHYNDAGDLVMRRFATNAPWKAYRLSRNRLHFAWRHYSLPQTLSVLFVFSPLVTFRYFCMAVVRGWPAIGFAFVGGQLAGTVQVLGQMAKRIVTKPHS